MAAPEKEARAPRARMTGTERRQQLIEIAKSLFAERGYDATSIEEIAQRANVSKPVVYEHFGGKEGLYAVVVDREMSALLDGITSSLTNNRSRVRVERVALALLTYVEERTDGFRILIRDSPASIASGTYSSLLNDAVSQVASILAGDFSRRGLDPELAPLYAQALVGSVSMTAQWWLDTREPKKEVVAAHLSIWAMPVRSGVDGGTCSPVRRISAMTHYLLSVHSVEGEVREPMSDEQMRQAYTQVGMLEGEMKSAGALVFSGRLHEPDTATVVRMAGSEVLTTDGPFMESKEHLGGFYIIEAEDLDAALGWASKVTAVIAAPIEVWPFRDAHGA